MFFNRCPKEDDLREFASQQNAARIAKHVAGCAICRAQLEQYSDDLELLDELRAAISGEADAVDESTRSQIMDTCLRASEEEEVQG